MLNALTPSVKTTKQALASHSWLGLFIAGFMYLICLTGTLAVLYEELERWEQPQVDEFSSIDGQRVEQAYQELLATGVAVTDHMFIGLPSPTLPRLTVSNEEQGWFVNQQGELGPKVNHEFTHMLANLHINLHLPRSFGVVLVSILGVLLCSLIVSGFVAHPSIFKDAFKLRLFGAKRLEQVDVHNRLSVWGAPFYLMIAITGAFFGLAMPLLGAYAYVTEQDTKTISQTVFGADPQVSELIGELKISKALQQIPELSPAAKPFYITVHGANTDKPHIEIRTREAQRLIYSESYHFDGNGNYQSKSGFSDGVAGKQIIYSIYRLHFGNFAGYGAKIIYLLLGLALTVVSATGVNIWLAKRNQQDWLNPLWLAIVWAAPVALILAAITQTVLAESASWTFFASYLLLTAACLRQKINRSHLQYAVLLGLVSLLLLRSVVFEAAAWNSASLVVNTLLIAIMFGLVGLLYAARRIASLNSAVVA